MNESLEQPTCDCTAV